MVSSFLLNKRKPQLKKEYSALVVVTYDDKGANRIKATIDGMTDLIPSDDLPFYSIAKSVTGSPNTNVSIPPVGSRVIIKLNGDIYNGEVIGTLTNISPM